MNADAQEQAQIEAGRRLTAFLQDDIVKGALARLGRSYFDHFKTASTPADRESAWAKARALDDFATELQAVIDTGTRTQAEVTRRERTFGKPGAR